MTDFSLRDDVSVGQPELWTAQAKAYGSLSREHSLTLMQKLATDDAFRTRFEQKPCAALAEIGVPDETVANLNPACLVTVKLADKGRFVEARKQLGEAAAHICVAMSVPTLKLDFGTRG